MDTLQSYIRAIEYYYVYGSSLAAFAFACFVDMRSWRVFFIFLISLPVTIYCFFCFTYGDSAFDLFSLVVNLLVFAQLGWVGGAISLISLWQSNKYLHNYAFGISVFSVFGHGIMLFLIYFSWSGS